MKKQIRFINKSTRAYEDIFQKKILEQFYRLNEQIANRLRRDKKIPQIYKDDSANDVLKIIDKFDLIDYDKLFNETALEVREKLWQPLKNNKIPVLKPNKAELRAIEKWITENTLTVKAGVSESKAKLYRIVANAYEFGNSQKEVARELSKEFKLSSDKSKFWARDMLGTLNAELSQKRDEALGIEYQTWITTGDGKVRPSHMAVNGQRYKVGVGIRIDGKMWLPGEDYNCRCYGESVIEVDV